MAEPTSFPPEISILGDFNCHHPLWDSGDTSDFRGEEVLDWAISSPSMTLTHPPFYIASLAVAPLMTSPLLPPPLSFLAPGRCFKTWVLTIYQFFYAYLPPQSFTPTSVLFPSIFRKLARMSLPHTLTLTVPLQRNTRLLPLLLISGTECGQIFHSFRPHQTLS